MNEKSHHYSYTAAAERADATKLHQTQMTEMLSEKGSKYKFFSCMIYCAHVVKLYFMNSANMHDSQIQLKKRFQNFSAIFFVNPIDVQR